MLNEDEKSGSLNNDLTYPLFWCSYSRSARGSHRRAALTMRYATAGAAGDFGKPAAATKPAENSSQFAVWLLKGVNLIDLTKQ
jgi:hypothetical protein